MNTMNMPGFSAAASLYRTGAHYRTGDRAIHLPAHTTGTIHLSEIDVPGEVIIIEDDAPWSPPSWGGHTGPGTSGGGDGDTGGGEPGGGGDGTPSKADPNDKPLPKSHGCSLNQLQSDAGVLCGKKTDQDLFDGIKPPHYLKCTGNKKGNVKHPRMECCRKVGKKEVCLKLDL